MLGNRSGTVKNVRVDAELAHIGGDVFGIETIFISELSRIMNVAENDFVGRRKSSGQRFLKDFAAHGVGARLENRPQTTAGPAAASSGNCRAHCRWVMREIVHD